VEVYPDRAFWYALLGEDAKAQQDVEAAVNLGIAFWKGQSKKLRGNLSYCRADKERRCSDREKLKSIIPSQAPEVPVENRKCEIFGCLNIGL